MLEVLAALTSTSYVRAPDSGLELSCLMNITLCRFTSVDALLHACGVGDDATYVMECQSYSSLVDSLVGKLTKAVTALGLTTAGSTAPVTPPVLSRAAVKARIAQVRLLHQHRVLVSVNELGGLFTATVIVRTGFAVNGVKGSYIRRICAPDGRRMADSLIYEELLRSQLPESVVLDASLIPGHFEAWKSGRPRGEDLASMAATARLTVEAGFAQVFTLGGPSRVSMQEAISTHAAPGFRRTTLFGGFHVTHFLSRDAADSETPLPLSTWYEDLVHPTLLLIKAVGSITALEAQAGVYDRVVHEAGGGDAVLGVRQEPGLIQSYVVKLTEGLAKPGQDGEFDSAKAIKSLRNAEIKTGEPMAWAKLPPLVTTELTLQEGVTTQAEWQAFLDRTGWQPRLDSTPEPRLTPCCWYLSVHGVEGGEEGGVRGSE